MTEPSAEERADRLVNDWMHEHAPWDSLSLEGERALRALVAGALAEKGTDTERLKEEYRSIVSTLWAEDHFYGDHKDDGFGDPKEACQESGCVRFRAYLLDGKPFQGYEDFNKALLRERLRSEGADD